MIPLMMMMMMMMTTMMMMVMMMMMVVVMMMMMMMRYFIKTQCFRIKRSIKMPLHEAYGCYEEGREAY